MKTCPSCGTANPDDAVYCSGCAYQFEGAPPPGQPPYLPTSGQPMYPAPPGQPPYPSPDDVYYQYPYPRFAGFWIRLAAYIIDAIILWIARYPIIIIFWLVNDNFSSWGGWQRGRAVEGTTEVVLYVLYYVIMLSIWFGYFIFMTGRYGATLGKITLRIKVVMEDLSRVSYGKAALRETVGKFLAYIPCFIGIIWIGFDSRKQGWQDKIAHTIVIYE